ncbi:uncharacterized protein LOC144654613 [Oculina patagonica]
MPIFNRSVTSRIKIRAVLTIVKESRLKRKKLHRQKISPISFYLAHGTHQIRSYFMEEENHLKDSRCGHDAQELCFVSALEDFIRSAEFMGETVLFPSILMDLTVNSLELNLSAKELYLAEGMDLRTFCHTVKSLKIQVTQGCSNIEEGLEENIQMRNKIEELCLQLRPSIRLAKYLGYASQEIALSNKPVSFQEFTAQEIERALLCEDHSSWNLNETLQLFMNAVEEMEQETLFPCLLKSHRALNYGCSLDSEQSLNELYVNVLQDRSVLLASCGKYFQSSAFYQIVSKLKTVFYFYTMMINKILVLYQEKVHEDY